MEKCLQKFNKKTCMSTFGNYRQAEVTYATLAATRASIATCAFWPEDSLLKEWCQLDQQFFVPPTPEICE